MGRLMSDRGSLTGEEPIGYYKSHPLTLSNFSWSINHINKKPLGKGKLRITSLRPFDGEPRVRLWCDRLMSDRG